MANFSVTGNEYKKIKDSYLNYLNAYKNLNKGSSKGATKFADFYIYKTFTSKYADPRKFLTQGIR